MYKPSCSLLLMSEKVLCACNIYQHSQHLHPHDNKESLDSMKCCKAYSSLYRIDSELISYRRIAPLQRCNNRPQQILSNWISPQKRCNVPDACYNKEGSPLIYPSPPAYSKNPFPHPKRKQAQTENLSQQAIIASYGCQKIAFHPNIGEIRGRKYNRNMSPSFSID